MPLNTPAAQRKTAHGGANRAVDASHRLMTRKGAWQVPPYRPTVWKAKQANGCMTGTHGKP